MTYLAPNKIELVETRLENKAKYVEWLKEEKPKLGLVGADTHTSSPICWTSGEDGQKKFIGGCDAVIAFVKDNFVGQSQALKGVPANAPDGVNAEQKFDYDLVCIGGGSGGLALTKAAGKILGEGRVACMDFVKPSTHGTKWGLGGTCVNVGCIPKKLCHRAAILGEEGKHDATYFGWEGGHSKHNWTTLCDNVHGYIKSLNFKYTVALRQEGVKYLNQLGSLVDNHTIQTVDRKGVVGTITAARIVIAVGGRPKRLEIPGGEHCIDSDDLFQIDWAGKEPGKTLCVGASYVSLECAGFLTGLGYDTSIMVRSILLRGFDRECADKIGEYMEKTGTKFIRDAIPHKIVKQDNGKLEVFWKTDGKDVSEVFDTVVVAIGRDADTSKLGLDKVGVQTSKNGKILCPQNNDQTAVPNIYAIGDVVEGMMELTPVAIQAAILLANRLFAGKTQTMDYDTIATTVFTPLEYGTIGLSEEAAIERYGADKLEIYHKGLSPLEWEMVKEKPEGYALAKLICLKEESMRVVGFHVLAPNAGEITQGYAVAMRKGATYQDFADTVGIHPTVSEDFTTLTVTKSSGASAKSSGC